jgi:histidinol-phosphate phosphatase family protein
MELNEATVAPLHAPSRPFVLLDRDGTLIEERPYLREVEEVRLLPTAVASLRRFRGLGLGLTLVTNQSGVARGYLGLRRLEEIHHRLEALLGQAGLGLDGIYFCPHLPGAGCECRKPKPGLGLRAAADLGIDLSNSFVIGDKPSDVEWGQRLGATTFLVRTGHGAAHAEACHPRSDYVVDDMQQAADIVETIVHRRTAEEPAAPPADARARLVRQHVLGSIDAKQRLLRDCSGEIIAAADILLRALRAGGKILLCGNGGSAADCQHIAAELMSALSHDIVRPALAAIALTTDTSLITAHANDFGFHYIFERQVQALGRPGDVLLGISTSGESENVLRAVRAARRQGMETIALTGPGGRLATEAAAAVRAPSGNTQHVQECHIMIGHLLCMLVERGLYPTGPRATDPGASILRGDGA